MQVLERGHGGPVPRMRAACGPPATAQVPRQAFHTGQPGVPFKTQDPQWMPAMGRRLSGLRLDRGQQ